RVQVLVGEKAVAQNGMTRDVRQDSKLDLTVVGAEQLPTDAGDERFADLRPDARADGDVLQIRVDGGEATRRGDCLIERGVQPPIFAERGGKRVEISRLELHQLPMLEHL